MRSFIAGGISALLFLSGCPDDEKRSCTDFQTPPGFDAQTPTVQLTRDVVPIFNRSCAFSDCHNTLSRNGLVLGDQNRIDGRTAHGNLVGKPSRTLPSLPYVTAGNPRESFLMHKMDGSHCTLDARCDQGNCGQAMPRSSDLLEEEERNVVRRWIAQGAKND
jgi:hypothetical protein